MGVRARESISLFSTVTVYNFIAAQKIRVDTLEANSVTTTYLEANYITATDIAATYVTTQNLEANYITASEIASDYVTAAYLSANYITADNIAANYVTSEYASATYATTDALNAVSLVVSGKADINLLNTTLINGEAIVTQLGYINNATITDLTTDKLRVLGEDGLYYAINVTGGAVTAEVAIDQIDVYGNQITGGTLIDKTVVADKLYVNDLSAIHGDIGTAFIGGLMLEESSIHSSDKTEIGSSNVGMMMNAAGELDLTGTNGYLRFYIDQNTGTRKLSISADEIKIGSYNVGDQSTTNENMWTAINNKADGVAFTSFKNDITRYLHFDADRGLVLSSDQSDMETVLTESAWQIQASGKVMQQVDGVDGAQFTMLTLKTLDGSGQAPKMVLGALTITVESDGTLTGRKTA